MLRQRARQRPHVRGDRERQPDRVTRGRVGVLTDDQHPYVGERSPEGLEDVVAGREVRPAGRDLSAEELTHPRDPLVDRREGIGPVGGHQATVDQPAERTHTGHRSQAPLCHSRGVPRSRRATVADLRELAASMPGVRIERGPKGNDVYQVSRRSFVFFRTPRPDAVDPETGERYDDVVVLWVESEIEKEALVADPSTPFFTTPHFDGHPSVLVRTSRIGELTRDELAEVVYDAWLARASKTAARRWLAEHGVS